MTEGTASTKMEIEAVWYRKLRGNLRRGFIIPLMLAAVLTGCGGGGSNPTEAVLVVRGFLNALLDPSGEALIPA